MSRNPNDAAPAPPHRPTSSSTPTTTKYVCRSPHCRSPDVPLADFELMEPIMQGLLGVVKLPLAELRERLIRREFGDDGRAEKMILDLCYEGLSFRAVKKRLRSVEVGKEVIGWADDIFDHNVRARQGKPPIGFVVAEYFVSCLTELFALIQRTILEQRTPTDGSTHFCLHDVYRNVSILRAKGRNSDMTAPKLLSVYKHAALWQEIQAGILSGRIAGAGWTLGERDHQDILDLFKDKTNQIMESVFRLDGRLVSASNHAQVFISRTTTTPLLELYCNFANDQNLFFDSPLLSQNLELIRGMKACSCSICTPAFPPSPSSPSTDSRTLCPNSQARYVWSHPTQDRSPSFIPFRSSQLLPSHPFLNLNRRDPFEDLGLTQQPRVCPPDRCSGQQPIEANYPSVEKDILRIVGWKLSAAVLEEEVDVLHSVLAVRVADEVGSLGVGTVESRRKILDSLPKVLREKTRASIYLYRRLHDVLCSVKSLLLSLQRSRQPCLCDLTHLCDQLSRLVVDAQSEFAKAYASPVLTADIATTTLHIVKRFHYAAEKAEKAKGAKWKTIGWETQVEAFAQFVNEPIASLLRNPENRVAAHDHELALVMVLGSSRILEEVNSIDIEADYPGYKVDTTFMDAVTKVLMEARLNVDDDGDDFYVSTVSAIDLREKADGIPTVLRHFNDKFSNYAAATIVDPTDYLSRLNSAALRLRYAGSRSEYSAAISDCTFAIFYGPPSYKAFYRRGHALAQLKMWDKAILDFERALALEPQDAFLKDRLALARRKKT